MRHLTRREIEPWTDLELVCYLLEGKSAAVLLSRPPEAWFGLDAQTITDAIAIALWSQNLSRTQIAWTAKFPWNTFLAAFTVATNRGDFLEKGSSTASGFQSGKQPVEQLRVLVHGKFLAFSGEGTRDYCYKWLEAITSTPSRFYEFGDLLRMLASVTNATETLSLFHSLRQRAAMPPDAFVVATEILLLQNSDYEALQILTDALSLYPEHALLQLIFAQANQRICSLSIARVHYTYAASGFRCNLRTKERLAREVRSCGGSWLRAFDPLQACSDQKSLTHLLACLEDHCRYHS